MVDQFVDDEVRPAAVGQRVVHPAPGGRLVGRHRRHGCVPHGGAHDVGVGAQPFEAVDGDLRHAGGEDIAHARLTGVSLAGTYRR